MLILRAGHMLFRCFWFFNITSRGDTAVNALTLHWSLMLTYRGWSRAKEPRRIITREIINNFIIPRTAQQCWQHDRWPVDLSLIECYKTPIQILPRLKNKTTFFHAHKETELFAGSIMTLSLFHRLAIQWKKRTAISQLLVWSRLDLAFCFVHGTKSCSIGRRSFSLSTRHVGVNRAFGRSLSLL